MGLGFIRFFKFLHYLEHPNLTISPKKRERERGGSTRHGGEVREPAETGHKGKAEPACGQGQTTHPRPNQRAIGPATPRQTGAARQDHGAMDPGTGREAFTMDRVLLLSSVWRHGWEYNYYGHG